MGLIIVMLGYPLVRLVVMSLQEYGLRQQFGAAAPWVGLENYGRLLTDDYFWDVLWRTITFAMVKTFEIDWIDTSVVMSPAV